MDAIYEVRGLTKRYGRTAALNGVDFAVTPGKLVGLLGPNGSGKTTLMKISAGLLQPTAGSVIAASLLIKFLSAFSPRLSPAICRTVWHCRRSSPPTMP